MKSKQRGFTIVELLIAIVVIGIIAALVINTFAEAQNRARASVTASKALSFYKGLVAYATVHGAYPSTGTPPGPGSSWACLGEGYPDANSDGIKECFYGEIAESAQFNDELKPYMGGSLPEADGQVVDNGGSKISGIVYSASSANYLDGQPHKFFVFYYVRGSENIKCPAKPLGTYSHEEAGPQWHYVSAQPANGISERFTDGNGCYMPLPNPETLQ